MGYIETSTSWDYVGITVYPLDENGQRITKTVGQDTVEVSYYLRDFGLYRVSNSNRYNDTLTPTIKHTTVEVPGGDGMYWFGSQHTQKQFPPVKFAYDNLEEKDLYTLRDLFKGKNRLHIIFDEYPYKYYDVVVSQAAQFDYVPFTEDRTVGNAQEPRRIFKGEGSVQFTSYTPYAIGTIKYWDKTEAPQNTWANYDELEGTNKILTHDQYNTKSVGVWTTGSAPAYGIWNGGDLPCDFKLTIKKEKLNLVRMIRIFVRDINGTAYELGRFQLAQNTPFPANEIDTELTFDSKLHLVYDASGKFFNKYLVSETLFTQIPSVYSTSHNNQYLYVTDFSSPHVPVSLDGYSTFEYNQLFY